MAASSSAVQAFTHDTRTTRAILQQILNSLESLTSSNDVDKFNNFSNFLHDILKAENTGQVLSVSEEAQTAIASSAELYKSLEHISLEAVWYAYQKDFPSEKLGQVVLAMAARPGLPHDAPWAALLNLLTLSDLDTLTRKTIDIQSYLCFEAKDNEISAERLSTGLWTLVTKAHEKDYNTAILTFVRALLPTDAAKTFIQYYLEERKVVSTDIHEYVDENNSRHQLTSSYYSIPLHQEEISRLPCLLISELAEHGLNQAEKNEDEKVRKAQNKREIMRTNYASLLVYYELKDDSGIDEIEKNIRIYFCKYIDNLNKGPIDDYMNLIRFANSQNNDKYMLIAIYLTMLRVVLQNIDLSDKNTNINDIAFISLAFIYLYKTSNIYLIDKFIKTSRIDRCFNMAQVDNSHMSLLDKLCHDMCVKHIKRTIAYSLIYRYDMIYQSFDETILNTLAKKACRDKNIHIINMLIDFKFVPKSPDMSEFKKDLFSVLLSDIMSNNIIWTLHVGFISCDELCQTVKDKYKDMSMIGEKIMIDSLTSLALKIASEGNTTLLNSLWQAIAEKTSSDQQITVLTVLLLMSTKETQIVSRVLLQFFEEHSAIKPIASYVLIQMATSTPFPIKQDRRITLLVNAAEKFSLSHLSSPLSEEENKKIEQTKHTFIRLAKYVIDNESDDACQLLIAFIKLKFLEKPQVLTLLNNSENYLKEEHAKAINDAIPDARVSTSLSQTSFALYNASSVASSSSQDAGCEPLNPSL